MLVPQVLSDFGRVVSFDRELKNGEIVAAIFRSFASMPRYDFYRELFLWSF